MSKDDAVTNTFDEVDEAIKAMWSGDTSRVTLTTTAAAREQYEAGNVAMENAGATIRRLEGEVASLKQRVEELERDLFIASMTPEERDRSSYETTAGASTEAVKPDSEEE